jgi:Tfp pilus assembly protein PilW
LRRGVGLVELLVCLAICSALLVAIGVAFHASASAVEVNDDFFRASQSARLVMTQLQTAIRRCDACSVPSTSEIRLVTPDGQDRSYLFEPTSRRLLLVRHAPSGDTQYVLAHNVTNAQFVADSETIPDTTTTQIVRVTAVLDVQVGTEQIHLSGSAVPRRTVAPEMR